MITHKEYDNGFKYIEIKNKHAEAKIALQGAHLFHYKAIGKPALLWLSKLAYFEKGKAIRGGIPICFPWFGKSKKDASLPQHGFARTQFWTVSLEEELDDGSTHVQLQLRPNAHTLSLWPYHFDLYLDVMIGQELRIALHVTNTDTQPFEISAALHTYFAVSDIKNICIRGLDGKRYYDALKNVNAQQQGDVTIEEEVDRVYMDPSPVMSLLDKEMPIHLKHSGSKSLVVWNPWIEKSKQMMDMPDDGYKHMVCLETSNAREDARTVNINESHVLKVMITQG